jgi:hypothetical protein
MGGIVLSGRLLIELSYGSSLWLMSAIVVDIGKKVEIERRGELTSLNGTRITHSNSLTLILIICNPIH